MEAMDMDILYQILAKSNSHLSPPHSQATKSQATNSQKQTCLGIAAWKPSQKYLTRPLFRIVDSSCRSGGVVLVSTS